MIIELTDTKYGVKPLLDAHSIVERVINLACSYYELNWKDVFKPKSNNNPRWTDTFNGQNRRKCKYAIIYLLRQHFSNAFVSDIFGNKCSTIADYHFTSIGLNRNNSDFALIIKTVSKEIDKLIVELNFNKRIALSKTINP